MNSEVVEHYEYIKVMDEDFLSYALWRTEESFRITRSWLGSLPVFVHKEPCHRGLQDGGKPKKRPIGRRHR